MLQKTVTLVNSYVIRRILPLGVLSVHFFVGYILELSHNEDVEVTLIA